MSRVWVGSVLLFAALLVAGLVAACGDDGPGDDGGALDDGPEADDGMTGSPATARFLADHVTPEGRVVRHDEGGDTVSEGQAYALLFAAGTGDEDRFALVWEWTQAELQRPDGLFAWRWADGAVVDDQPAADADLDVAAALLLAAERFERPEWAEEARRVADAVMEHETFTADDRLLLAAGPWAVEDGVVNPSYLARCDYGELAELTGDDRWTQLGEDGLAVVADLVDEGLPPDWARVAPSGEVTAVAAADAAEGPGRYGLDAARIPVRLAACDEGTEIAAALWSPLAGTDGEGAALAYGPDGERLADAEHPLGLVATAAAAKADGEDDEARRLLDAALDLDRATPTYYGAAWAAFGEALLADDAALVSTRTPLQEPTTTTTPGTPVTTTTPTTSPTTTAPGTTPTTTDPGTTTETTEEPDGTGPSTTPGEAPAAPPAAPATTAPATTPAAGDIAEPGAVEQLPGRGSSEEPGPARRARRTTGALALGGLAASVVLGGVLGLRERRSALRA